MGRARRKQTEPLCYHVTHRCHGRDFLLKFKQDRRNYLLRLHEMSRRFPIDVLSYMVTSNHVHLLIWSDRALHVSSAMHFLQGTVAGDYNRRKGREGAFWRGRHHPTLVETGSHLSRCLFYMEMNMVRVGACAHPCEWVGGPYAEILGQRQRYRIVNRDRLKWCLGMPEEPDSRFGAWYTATVDELVAQRRFPREPHWSEALAAGSEQWVETLLPNVRNVRMERIDDACQPDELREADAVYAAYAPKRSQQDFWRIRND